jgi:hypothetical protein
MESFILYTSQYPAIKSLSKSAKGELLEALYQYALTGKIMAFSNPETEMAFNFIRIRIDENDAKYLSVCEKRRAAGRKGGRPRKGNTKNQDKANKPNAFSKSKAKQKKLTDTESISTDTLSEVSSDTSQKKQKKENAHEPSFSDVENISYDDQRQTTKNWEQWYMQIIKIFNEAVSANESSIRPVRTLSESRREALKVLWQKYHYSGKQFKQAFGNIARSNYCNGRTSDRRRPVDFDWLIREENFNRAYEGSL